MKRTGHRGRIGRREILTDFWWGNLKKKPFGIPRHRRDDSVEVFKVIRLVGIGRKQGAGTCGHCGRISDFIKFKKYSAAQNYLQYRVGSWSVPSMFLQNYLEYRVGSWSVPSMFLQNYLEYRVGSRSVPSIFFPKFVTQYVGQIRA